MKAAQITAPDKAQVIEVEAPTPGPDDVLIQIHVAGICGTDIHIFHGEYEANYPVIPGHEFSGVVTAVGENVTRFKVGDRVTADPNVPCNRCPACQRGEANQCHNLRAVGVTGDGGFAEYVVVPEGSVFSIGSLTFPQAALVEPLACVVWGLKRVEIQPGDAVVIFGAGPMGCLLLQAVRHVGATTVVITDVVPSRLELAEQLGATAIMADDQMEQRLKEIAPLGYDVVADATGLPQVLQDSFAYVRPRGKVWVFGVVPPTEKIEFVPYDVFRKDISIIGSFAVNRTFSEAIAMIESGAVKVDPLISHQLELDDFCKGLDIAENNPQRMKVQFTIA
jgi:D-arabinitol dehydrogenase (NADP+)